MNEPTQEQIKRFWEYFGIRQGSRIAIGNNPNAEVYNWHFPDGLTTMKPPKLDLNNLFKYAVPKLQEINSEILIRFMFGSVNRSGIYEWTKRYSRKKNFEWLEMGAANNDDPALALFWAIYKVIEGES